MIYTAIELKKLYYPENKQLYEHVDKFQNFILNQIMDILIKEKDNEHNENEEYIYNKNIFSITFKPEFYKNCINKYSNIEEIKEILLKEYGFIVFQLVHSLKDLGFNASECLNTWMELFYITFEPYITF